jgi:hypothetical protein
MTRLSEVRVAYVAGLFDGEGYIRCDYGHHWEGRKENMEFWITVSNNYRPVIGYLYSTLGGSMHKQPRKNPKHKMGWMWKLGPQGAMKLLSRMAPYLQIKSEQANHVLKHKALITKKGPRKESERVILRRLTKRMRELTRRGVPDDMVRE